MFGIYDTTTEEAVLLDYAFDKPTIESLLHVYKEEIENDEVYYTFDAPHHAKHVREHILNHTKSVFRNANTGMTVYFELTPGGLLCIEIEGVLFTTVVATELKDSVADRECLHLRDLTFDRVDEWELVE